MKMIRRSGKERVRIERTPRWFYLAVGTFVTVSSFLYGLSAGINKRIAEATGVSSHYTMRLTGYPSDKEILLPTEVYPSALGKEVQINGRAGAIEVFVTNRDVRSLLSEQISLWESQGYTAAGKTDRERGVALARDATSGKRFWATAWVVPATLRESVSQGFAVQGISAAFPDNEFVNRSSLSAEGEVPGVPLRQGGRSGALFSALDPGGRSYTGSYTLPRDVADNIAYYRSVLEGEGWQLIAGVYDVSRPDIGALTMTRDGEELSLLFAELAARTTGRLLPETVLTVTRSSSGALNKMVAID